MPYNPLANNMNAYLVGGAVRDTLLGLPVRDRDYVVVGSTPEQMLNAGFKSVGRDFPVFLHPQSHEEYALARLERKTAPGYQGFAFDTSPSVTLEQDLSRRDLTINAMAQTTDGQLVDPYHGAQDLQRGILRHVSTAFVEDPVRVLRVARFMARFSHRGFTVAEETMQLMQDMVRHGEVDHLVPERVWQELFKALQEPVPSAFFDTLDHCGALQVIMPELVRLQGVEQPARWHPEIDSYVHTQMVLQQSVRLGGDGAVRFAALCHDLGKGTTPKEILPSHHGHEKRGADLTGALCERLRVPGLVRDLAVISARYHTHCHKILELRPSTILKTLRALDVRRKPERFAAFLQVCEADSRGRLGFEDRPYPQAALFAEAARVYSAVDAGAIARHTSDAAQIAQNIADAQLQQLKVWRQQYE